MGRRAAGRTPWEVRGSHRAAAFQDADTPKAEAFQRVGRSCRPVAVPLEHLVAVPLEGHRGAQVEAAQALLHQPPAGARLELRLAPRP